MHSSFSQKMFMLIIGEGSVSQEQVGIKIKMDMCKGGLLELTKNAQTWPCVLYSFIYSLV